MRKILTIVLIALLLGVGVVAVIETDPGYVLVSYGNYTLETSLWVGLVLLILFTLVVYAVFRLVYRLIGGRQSLVSWLGARKHHRASRLTRRGLISFIEGNWFRARRQLLRGAKNNEAPLLNYLLAARASHRLGETDKVSDYLAAAGDTQSGAATAVALTRAELQLHGAQYEQVIATLEHLGSSAARHPRVLELLQQACYAVQDWDRLSALLPEIKKHNTLALDKLQQLQAEVHTRLLQQSAAAAEGAAADNLHKAWQRMPADMKQDPQLLQYYVGLLLQHDADAAAEKVIVRALKQQWDSGLVRQYGYVESDDVPRQLARAESWLASHTDDAQLLLCLGRLSARDRLWGKARDYFESSYRLQRSSETCAELGRLLTGLGESRIAAAYFREGLLLREHDLPQLPMPEKILPQGRRLARS